MITQNYLTISPAYGRDYKNKAAAELEFQQGLDFKMESIGSGGTYCSIRDFAPLTKVNIRYNALRKVCVVEVPALPTAVTT